MVFSFCFDLLQQRPIRHKATPKPTEDISSSSTTSDASHSPPAALSESFLLPDLSELSISSDDIDFSPPPGPPDNKPPLPSMCPSSPIFEEDTFSTTLFDDIPFPSWNLDDPKPKTKNVTPITKTTADPFTIETKSSPPTKGPPKIEKVKTPPPILAKPPKKRPGPGMTNSALVLPPFVPLTLRETPKKIGEKPDRPSSDDIFAKKVQYNRSDIDLIPSGMTNGKMSIGSPETKNKINKSIFGEMLERKVEVKPYRSSSASEVQNKKQTEVRLNPSFCVNIAEKKVTTKPRSSSLEIPDDKLDNKLDANQNKTKSLVIFSSDTCHHSTQTDSTQTDPVDYNLNLTNGVDPLKINQNHFKSSNDEVIGFKPTKAKKVGIDLELLDIFSDEKSTISPSSKRSCSLDPPEKVKPSGVSSRALSESDGLMFSEKQREERDPIITGEIWHVVNCTIALWDEIDRIALWVCIYSMRSRLC